MSDHVANGILRHDYENENPSKECKFPTMFT